MKTPIQYKFLILFSPFIFLACKDKAEIKTTVENVYELKLIECDTKDFSEELRNLLQDVTLDSNSNSVKIESINNQPPLLKRKLLTANTKGFTDFQIKNIGISYNKATALISLSNDDQAISWTDTVHLVYQKRWKIDDIKYDQNLLPSSLSLKNLLLKSKREVYG